MDAIKDLIDRLIIEPVTSVTPPSNSGEQPKPSSSKAVTLVTPVTPTNTENENNRLAPVP